MTERLRRTMLYVPGNNPRMLRDAGIYGSDSIMFDLEDSVSVAEKDAARILVHEALTALDPEGKEYLVRINSLESGLGVKDLEAVVSTGKAGIRLPKTETAKDVTECEVEISRLEEKYGLKVGSTVMMAAVESAAGVLNAEAIAAASPRLVGIAIGAEDYVTDLLTTRSPGGVELLFGRSMILLAARAAGIAAIDTVYSDVTNEEGLRQEVELIKQLGFDGKSVVNPRQIGVVHEIYTPTQEEIGHALAVLEGIKEAELRGSGVIAVDGKMVDRPMVLRAQRALDLARASGVLKKEGEYAQD